MHSGSPDTFRDASRVERSFCSKVGKGVSGGMRRKYHLATENISSQKTSFPSTLVDHAQSRSNIICVQIFAAALSVRPGRRRLTAVLIRNDGQRRSLCCHDGYAQSHCTGADVARLYAGV